MNFMTTLRLIGGLWSMAIERNHNDAEAFRTFAADADLLP